MIAPRSAAGTARSAASPTRCRDPCTPTTARFNATYWNTEFTLTPGHHSDYLRQRTMSLPFNAKARSPDATL